MLIGYFMDCRIYLRYLHIQKLYTYILIEILHFVQDNVFTHTTITRKPYQVLHIYICVCVCACVPITGLLHLFGLLDTETKQWAKTWSDKKSPIFNMIKNITFICILCCLQSTAVLGCHWHVQLKIPLSGLYSLCWNTHDFFAGMYFAGCHRASMSCLIISSHNILVTYSIVIKFKILIYFSDMWALRYRS